MQRRLTTVMAADIVGYSSQTRADEDDTLRRLANLRGMVEAHVVSFDGRPISWAGDGFLAEFSSPIAAVRAGFELQRELAAPVNHKTIAFQMRIGLHLAEVVVDGADLLGDGVNVASRIEAIAEPGAVCLSRPVFDQVKRGAQLTFQPLGAQQLKGIDEPVEIFSVFGDLANHSCTTSLDPDGRLANFPSQEMPPNAVLVLPFENISSDPEQDYLADGFTDDIITELSRFSDLTVISRNASFGLRNSAHNLSEICPRLGARFCLEGGIRKMGPRIRIACHLSDGKTGKPVWSERIDATFDEVFDVQDDLIAKIVASVAGRIEKQRSARAERKRPMDMEAYDCLLRGLAFHRIGGVTRENGVQSLVWLDRAIEKDPTMARAYAWKACALSTVAEWDRIPLADGLEEYRDLASRALDLDETDAESHRIMGSISLYSRDYDRALYHFGRAVEMNPNHAYNLGRIGEIHNFLGDGTTALKYQKQALKLDPFLPEYCREMEIVAHYVLGEFSECHRVASEMPRRTRRSAAYHAAALVHLPDDALRKRASRNLSIVDPDFSPDNFLKFEFYRDPALSERLRADLIVVRAEIDKLVT